jgi:hypothetical protein
MAVETHDTPGSSHILQFAYDDEMHVMEVAFTDGSIYEARGVDRSFFDGAKAARSAGQYYNRALKNRFLWVPK